MIDSTVIKALQTIVGKDRVSNEIADLICYSYDATQQKFLPGVVVHPRTADEISAIMKLANERLVPVYPRGAGSGFTGGTCRRQATVSS